MLPATQVTGRQVGAALTELLAPWAAGAALDAMLNVGLDWANPEPDVPIAEQSSAQIAGGLTIKIDMGEIRNDVNITNGVIAELAARADGMSAIENALSSPPFAAPPTTDGPLAQATDNDLALLRKAMDRQGKAPDGLSEPARANLRKSTRRSTDGARVSKELHEYNYCLRSGQIDGVYDVIGESRNAEHSYGRFVDSPLMRRAIEEIRKIRRLARSKNVKFVLDLFDITTELLESRLQDSDSEFAARMLAATQQYEGIT